MRGEGGSDDPGVCRCWLAPLSRALRECGRAAAVTRVLARMMCQEDRNSDVTVAVPLQLSANDAHRR